MILLYPRKVIAADEAIQPRQRSKGFGGVTAGGKPRSFATAASVGLCHSCDVALLHLLYDNVSLIQGTTKVSELCLISTAPQSLDKVYGTTSLPSGLNGTIYLDLSIIQKR